MNDAQRKIVEPAEALRLIVAAYDAYRRRGVAPAPTEYADVVAAIDAGRAALLAQSTPPPAREIVKIPAIESELVRRLYAAEEDYTTEWGSGELYGQAADAMRRLIWALHWVATRSTNGLLMAPRDLPMEGFVRDEIAAVDAAPDSAAPPCACEEPHLRGRHTPQRCYVDMEQPAAQADAPEGERCPRCTLPLGHDSPHRAAAPDGER